MNYIPHVLIGLFCGVIVFALLNHGTILALNLDMFVNLIIFLLFVFLGSTLPDTDLGNSRPTKIMFTALLIILPLAFFLKSGLIGIVYGIIAFLIVCAIYKILRPPHRSWTHSIAFMVTIGVAIFLITNTNWNLLELPQSIITNYAFMGYIVGNLSHLLADWHWKLI